MAGVARKRVTRRVPYAALRERLFETQLPWDDGAERAAIGAVLLAPNGQARRLVRRAYSGHFYDQGHGWLWEQMGIALGKGQLDLDNEAAVREWVARVLVAFRRRFHGTGRKEIWHCLEAGFWWHGDYHIDIVLKAAKARQRVITAAELLGEALDNAERWRA